MGRGRGSPIRGGGEREVRADSSYATVAPGGEAGSAGVVERNAPYCQLKPLSNTH